MNSHELYILGAGGHAKSVIAAAKLQGKKILGLYDDNPEIHSNYFYGVIVKGNIQLFNQTAAIIGIGDNKVRKQINELFETVNWQTVIHPKAIIAEDVKIGPGSVIMAGAIIQPGASIGSHCIINTGACIDHDCEIDDFAHISPNCSLAGGVKIGEGVLVGIGSSIIPYKKVGNWSTIGAGSVVITDQPDYCICFGVPAKPIEFQNE